MFTIAKSSIFLKIFEKKNLVRLLAESFFLYAHKVVRRPSVTLSYELAKDISCQKFGIYITPGVGENGKGKFSDLNPQIRPN